MDHARQRSQTGRFLETTLSNAGTFSYEGNQNIVNINLVNVNTQSVHALAEDILPSSAQGQLNTSKSSSVKYKADDNRLKAGESVKTDASRFAVKPPTIKKFLKGGKIQTEIIYDDDYHKGGSRRTGTVKHEELKSSSKDISLTNKHLSLGQGFHSISEESLFKQSSEDSNVVDDRSVGIFFGQNAYQKKYSSADNLQNILTGNNFQQSQKVTETMATEMVHDGGDIQGVEYLTHSRSVIQEIDNEVLTKKHLESLKSSEIEDYSLEGESQTREIHEREISNGIVKISASGVETTEDIERTIVEIKRSALSPQIGIEESVESVIRSSDQHQYHFDESQPHQKSIHVGEPTSQTRTKVGHANISDVYGESTSFYVKPSQGKPSTGMGKETLVYSILMDKHEEGNDDERYALPQSGSNIFDDTQKTKGKDIRLLLRNSSRHIEL